MEIPPCDIVDLGNLAIGIGTFTLATVFGIVSWRSAIQDRAVHIADKRQEWVSTFRKTITDIFSLQQHYDSVIDDCSIEELDLMLREWNTHTNLVKFMLPNDMKVRDRLEDLFHEIFEELRVRKKSKNRSGDQLAEKQMELIRITDAVLKVQREKIVNLDNSGPLI